MIPELDELQPSRFPNSKTKALCLVWHTHSTFLYVAHTNQVFPILTNEQRDTLSQKWGFEPWAPIDEEKAAYRFVAAWNTDEQKVDELCEDIMNIKH